MVSRCSYLTEETVIHIVNFHLFLFPFFIDKRLLHITSPFPAKGSLQKHPLAHSFPFWRGSPSVFVFVHCQCVFIFLDKKLGSFFFFVYTRCLPMFQLTLYYVLFLGGSACKSGSLDLECTEDFPSYQQKTK